MEDQTIQEKLKNGLSIVAKYNKKQNTFEVPIHYIDMISSLDNAYNKKNNQKRKIKFL